MRLSWRGVVMDMKKQSLYAILITSLVWSMTGAALAQGEGCLGGGCHEDMWAKRWVQGPVGAGMCLACHEQTGDDDHSFRHAAAGQSLCLMCHEEKGSPTEFSHVHTPVSTGDCVGCHDPHQSDHRYQLRGQGSELCFVCHERDEFEGASQHGPVAEGDCNACHDPHAANNEFQLMSARDRVCFDCHPEKESQLGARHQHPPVQEDCAICHNPHSDAAPFMMAEPMPQPCFQCHEDVQAQMHSSVPHPPVSQGDCTSCHEVHGSAHPRLFKQAQEKMCLDCHEELGSYIAESASRHGPAQEGDCIACHDGHGSDQPNILRQYFPKEFYNAFSVSRYALCFNCHNKEMTLDSLTTTLTGFRDGDVNLHYKHVNKKTKGRSCKACHEAHASNQEKHIRKSVPFGRSGFNYPISFTKDESGGTCVVGCHRPQTYSRTGS